MLDTILNWYGRRRCWRQLLTPVSAIGGMPSPFILEDLLKQMNEVDPGWRQKETTRRRVRRALAWIRLFGIYSGWKKFVAEAEGETPWIPSLSNVPGAAPDILPTAAADILWVTKEHPDAVLRDFERREKRVRESRKAYCARQEIPGSDEDLDDLTAVARLDYLHACSTARGIGAFSDQTWTMVTTFVRHDARGVLVELMEHRVLDLSPPEPVRRRLAYLLSTWDTLEHVEQRESDGAEYNAPTSWEWDRLHHFCIDLWIRFNARNETGSPTSAETAVGSSA